MPREHSWSQRFLLFMRQGLTSPETNLCRGSPLSPCGSRGSNSALQVWWASVPDDPYFNFFQSGSRIGAQADLKPTVLPPQSAESWDDSPHNTWLLAIFILATAKIVGGEKKN
ncbi:hypothetical protein LEMLEM_LOCUS13134 [Lemmus lemmus]